MAFSTSLGAWHRQQGQRFISNFKGFQDLLTEQTPAFTFQLSPPQLEVVLLSWHNLDEIFKDPAVTGMPGAYVQVGCFLRIYLYLCVWVFCLHRIRAWCPRRPE